MFTSIGSLLRDGDCSCETLHIQPLRESPQEAKRKRRRKKEKEKKKKKKKKEKKKKEKEKKEKENSPPAALCSTVECEPIVEALESQIHQIKA